MKRLRHIVIRYLTKNLLKAVHEDDILRKSGRDYLVGKHKFSTDEIVTLKEEAIALEGSYLWQLIKGEIGWTANQQMFDKAMTNDDILWGKATLYALSLIENYINRIKSL